MRKPSIFSKEYERKMKRRKRMLIIIVIVAIICILAAFFIKVQGFPSDIKSKIVSIFNKSKTDEGNKKDNNLLEEKNKEDEKVQEAANNQEENSSEKEEDKEFDVALSSGNTIKVTYKEDNGVRMYESVAPLENGTTFSISPTQHSLLIVDGSTQELKLFDQNGNEKDLTFKSYKTRDGRVFTREQILSSQQGYKWCENAKFLDDNKIVYLSNLPWFGTGNLDTYLWMLDLQTGNYQTLFNVKGKEIILGNLTDKGLEITIDGNSKFLTANGELIN